MDVMHERDSGQPALLPSTMLHACVVVNVDDEFVRRAAALRVEGVRWVQAGSVAAFVADHLQLACDAARRVMVPPAAGRSLSVPGLTLQHEAHYTWPLSPDTFTPSTAIARNDGDVVGLWTDAPVNPELLADLVSATGISADRFRFHALDAVAGTPAAGTPAAGMPAVTIAAAVLMKATASAVCVGGYFSVSPAREAAISVAASLDDAGNLLDWQYVARTPGVSEIDTAAQDASPYSSLYSSLYSSRRSRSLIDDPAALIPRAAHAFARESFIDEIASERHRDPIAFRLDHLDAAEYEGARELIRSVAERAAWNGRPERSADSIARGRGFAFDENRNEAVPAYSAWIVDLDVDRLTGGVALRRVVAGRASGRLEPGRIGGVPARLIAAAASRALGLQLTARPSHDETPGAQAVSHELVLASGLPASGSSMALPADIATASIDTSPAAAAIANALFDATGVRFRAPPFTPERVRAALDGVALESAASSGIGSSGPGKPGKPIKRPLKTWLAASGLGGMIGLACTLWPVRAPIEPIARPLASTWSEATIERGRQIAEFGDCAVCHTARGGVTNAGGLGLETPFGMVYTTNLTPDPKTGIGNWSFAAFDRAMRQGISRDGRHLYPAFPYTAFTKMTEADMTALYAYLMSQPAVEHAPPQTRLPFPLNQRALVAGWNALYLKQGEYRPDPARSAQWNRGQYLVDGAGHCSACHSPRNALGAEKNGRAYLTGGSAEGWVAPSLVGNSKAPVRWTEQALYDYLKTGFSHEHGVAAGPMAPVVAGLSTLPDADVRAMAHYVASLSGSRSAMETGVGPAHATRDQTAVTPQGLDSGRRIFDGACAVCHAATGGVGNFGVRPLLSLNTSVSEATPDNLLKVIQDGIDAPATDALGYMPGFRDSFDDRQMADLVTYIRATFAPNEAPWRDLEQASARVRKHAH